MLHHEKIIQTAERLKNFAQMPYGILFQSGPDNRIPPESADYHVHEFWELKFSEQPPCLLLHAPETVHCSTVPDMVLGIAEDHLQIGELAVYPSEKHLQASRMLLQVMQNMNTLSGTRSAIRKIADALLDTLQNTLQQYAFNASGHPVEQKPEDRALDYLKHNSYRSFLCVSDVAEHLNISVQNLNRILRKKTGMSLRKHLIQIRLTQAERLLANPDYLIKEVAVLTGWRSPYYFCNCFKKYRNISPLEWRKKQIQKTPHHI